MNSQDAKTLWGGRIITAPPPVAEAFTHLGYPPSVSVTLGIIELVCIALYLIPRTAFFGAILLTGYLGGATATNVRVGDPSYFMTVLLGVLAWIGLYLRDDRLRALIFPRS